MFQKIAAFVKKRKVTTGIIIVVIIASTYFGVDRVRGSTTPVRYVLGTAAKGTLINSISGSGQITVSDQVDIKAKASGDLLTITVKEGQEVKANTIIGTINARDAYKTVRDAQVNLETAQLQLQKIKEPPTAYELLQAQNSVASAETSIQKLMLSQSTDRQKAEQAQQSATDALAKGYDDAYNTLANVYTDLPDVISGVYTILYSQEIGDSESSVGPGTLNDSALLNSILTQNPEDRDTLQAFIIKAKSDYLSAKADYDASTASYKNITRSSEPAQIEAVLNQTISATKHVADAVKNETSILDFWSQYRTLHQQSIFSKVKTYQTNIDSYTTKTSSDLSSLLSTQKSIADNKQAIITAAQSIKALDQNAPLDLAAAKATLAERQQSLANLRAGAEALDIRSQEISVRERNNTLLDARQKLADYTVRAPFDGVVAKVSVKKGDSISSGTTITTLITKQRIAQIALNELDAAKVKVGQKVTLTFDAVADLGITGQVATIDTLGTVSQGVVTYTATIVFDTQDDRIKPGMTVSASIITEVKPDVLLVPASAVKNSNGTSYVLILDNPDTAVPGTQGVTAGSAPYQQAVETGSSNDTSVEIISGITEGQEIVTRTIQPSTTAAGNATAPSLFSATGATGRATTGRTTGSNAGFTGGAAFPAR